MNQTDSRDSQSSLNALSSSSPPGEEDAPRDASCVPEPRPRGFAALTPEKRRALGSLGGRRAHALGTANAFTSETGSLAGKIPHERGTAYRWTREEASAAGRKGAGVSRRRRKAH